MKDYESNVWRLILGGRKYLGLIPHDLNYFNSHFNGSPMRLDWPPPPVEIHGKSKKVPDFVSWMTSAPVVSEKAKSVLSPVIGESVQFLPFIKIKNKQFYALNVLAVKANVLDLERSEILFSSCEPRKILSLHTTIFSEDCRHNFPPIFKVSEAEDILGDIFVTDKFAEIIVQHQLTGAALADPNTPILPLVLAQKSVNAVPGVPE